MLDNTNEYLKPNLTTGESITVGDSFIAFVSTPHEGEKLLKARRRLKENGQMVGQVLLVADSTPWENIAGSLRGSWEVTAQISPYVKSEEEADDETENPFNTLVAHKPGREILVSFGDSDVTTEKLIFNKWFEVQFADLASFNLDTIKDKIRKRKDVGELLLSKEQLTETIFQFLKNN